MVYTSAKEGVPVHVYKKQRTTLSRHLSAPISRPTGSPCPHSIPLPSFPISISLTISWLANAWRGAWTLRLVACDLLAQFTSSKQPRTAFLSPQIATIWGRIWKGWGVGKGGGLDPTSYNIQTREFARLPIPPFCLSDSSSCSRQLGMRVW